MDIQNIVEVLAILYFESCWNFLIEVSLYWRLRKSYDTVELIGVPPVHLGLGE